MIKANDTDVLVINVAINMCQILNDIGLEKLLVAFGQGSNLWWIPIHDIRRFVGSVKSKRILLLHAFTDRDVVSAFRGKGKRVAWQTRDVYFEASEVFAKLSMYPPVFGDK